MSLKILSILIVLCCILKIYSCNKHTTYNRSDNPNAVLIKSYNKAIKMKNTNKEFAVLFTFTNCPYCHFFHQMLKTYSNTYEVFINEVI